MVEGNHVVYRISAPTPEEKEEWIKSIKYGGVGVGALEGGVISADPFTLALSQ